MNSEVPDINSNIPLHSIQLERYLPQSTQKLDITHIYTVKQNICRPTYNRPIYCNLLLIL